MKWGIVNDKGKLIAIFKQEIGRDLCYHGFIRRKPNGFARVKVEDGIML